MKERKRRSVLQSARADGDGMRKPPGHLITGRREVLRKGGGEEARSVRCMCDVCGEELVAASKQFRLSRGEKSTRLELVALTVGHALFCAPPPDLEFCWDFSLVRCVL